MEIIQYRHVLLDWQCYNSSDWQAGSEWDEHWVYKTSRGVTPKNWIVSLATKNVKGNYKDSVDPITWVYGVSYSISSVWLS